MRRHRIALAALAAVITASVVVAFVTHSVAPSSGPTAVQRTPAPALPTEVMVPPQVTVASLRGKPAVINFWASWCEPCKAEAAGLEQFAVSLQGRVSLVGINWNDGLDSGRRFVATYHWTFPVLRDPDGVVGDEFGVHGLPATYILDANGQIVDVFVGPATAADIQAALRQLRLI
jgi:cytochrome c biogenesis protein CcmG, thiol:disulfide interchange protein DsbE